MMLPAKNYQNRPMLHGVIQKMKVARCITERSWEREPRRDGYVNWS